MHMTTYLINTATRKMTYTLGIASLLLLQSCATIEPEFADPRDPYEDLNREIYAVNEIIDLELLKPISRGYQAMMPPLVTQGVSNFFSNLGNVTTLVNSLFQSKFAQAGQTAARFALNSTCLLYTSPSPRDGLLSRMPSSA